MNMVVGQRFVSHTESNLGLGIVIEITGRIVVISFPAVNEIRNYAKDNAPISRIVYAVGDIITNMNGQEFKVQNIESQNGLVIYNCINEQNKPQKLSELHLNCFVHFTTPRQRLLSGQFGGNSAFSLRFEALNHLHRLQQSSISGLLGARIDLLPHQIYIANEVAHRHAPRVLLADEVGLGKTIEAGLILHQQIHSGRASKVLILVPDSLVHQWLVEMLRRFNLAFSIFDKTHIEALESIVYEFDEEDEDIEQLRKDFPENANPFDSEQKILCSLSLLSENPKIQLQALEIDWDLIIVDEAHHLEWSPHQVSIEYQCIEQLAAKNCGLLLLTATPEQAGIEGHFARLRLLDPDRFYSLDAFKVEQLHYHATNDIANHIIQLISFLGAGASTKECKKIESCIQNELPKLLKNYDSIDFADIQSLEKLLDRLVDQQGTGRVLFRNTRSSIQGFPERKVHAYPLDCPEDYLDSSTHEEYIKNRLFPEFNQPENTWLNQDPRVEWLVQHLKNLKPAKALIICHHASTCKIIDKHLNLKCGIRSTAFYPGLSIVERDRAAAYFSDDESGAQVLVCSEIGSEGRNFQFAHHLVLFDLPLNPDLIEQRIGRLDRIGQQQTIHIHVPYLKHSAQQVLFNWYHQGLNLFEQSCSAGYAIYQHFSEQLTEALNQPEYEAIELLQQTTLYAEKLRQEMHQGRDKLLELNSCKPQVATKIIEDLLVEENNHLLADFMIKVFDEMGVENEVHSKDTWVIRPGEHMQSEYFPGLSPDGNTITVDRNKALSREDIEFISWEHPMIQEVMEMIQENELGKASVATISVKGLPPSTILLESLYTVETLAPRDLQLERYLPLNPQRFLFSLDGKNLSKAVAHKSLNEICKSLPRKISTTVVAKLKDEIDHLINISQQTANKTLPDLKLNAQQSMRQDLEQELNRMQSLQAINPMIRNDEIQYIQKKIEISENFIQKAQLVMQGLRVIINQT